MKKVVLVLSFISGISTLLNAQDNNYVPGEIIVMLKPGEDPDRISRAFGFAGLQPKEAIVDYMNIWLYEYNQSGKNASLLLNEIRKHNSVKIAQFNHYVTQRSTIPNDPDFNQQWALNNTGQSGGKPDADIDAPEAWGLSTSGLTAAGDSIVIAIIDGGFYLDHPDIKFWRNWDEIPANGIDDDNNGYIDDVNGWNAFDNNGLINIDNHGTHCSGIAGAKGNNGLGVSGVNWNVKIMGISVVNALGTEAVVIRAYGYALKQRRMYDQSNSSLGAFVVVTNSSFGVNRGQPSNFPLWCAFYDSLGAAGILSAGSTANANWNIDSLGDIPTACPSNWMIAVTNTTRADIKNSGAGYGLTTIDLGAPGTSVYSTIGASSYSNLTGTSMAAPHVAGAIAFLYSVAPLSWLQSYKSSPGPYCLQVKQKIMQGVDVIPALQNITVSGGRLNLYNSALLMQNLTGTNNGNPVRFKLYQNYPNPFNPTSVITFDMPNEGFATLKVYNSLGQEVAVLVNGVVESGVHQKVFNADLLPSGVYFYKLVSDGFSDVKKMSLVK